MAQTKEVPPKRGEPNLSDDYYGEMYIVVDDDGEPVSPYCMRLKRAREFREDAGGEYLLYRIVEVAYKALPRDDGEPDRIIDDPRAKPGVRFVERHHVGTDGRRSLRVRIDGSDIGWVFETPDGTFNFSLTEYADPSLADRFEIVHENRGVAYRDGLEGAATFEEIRDTIMRYVAEESH